VTSSNFDDNFGDTYSKIHKDNFDCNKILASSDANLIQNSIPAHNFEGSVSLKSSNSGTFTIGQLKDS